MKKENSKKLSEQTALFRYGLIADSVQLPPGTKGLYQLIRKKAERQYTYGCKPILSHSDIISQWSYF